MELEKIFSNSNLHKKVVRFFHENPATIDTLRGVSTEVYADEKLVKKVLSELTQVGVLSSLQGASTIAYSYTYVLQIIEMIEKVLNNKKKSSF